MANKTMNMEWIEGKPKEDGHYIVSTEYGEVLTLNYWHGMWNATAHTQEYALEDSYVVAWMEMPKAYKEENA